MSLAPIILFVYNRPEHTRQTLEALTNNELAKDSILYVFADGIKENANESAIQKIEETRAIIKSKQWCKEVIIIERTENLGLAKSIIDGVTQIVDQFGKVIVLEDDLVTSKYFLKFMNDALHKYETEDKIACISAYIYPIENLPELFFIKGADCWGWATWKRSWDLFDANGEKLLQELESKKLTYEFDLNGSYPYTKMLRDQIKNINNSWAVRWYATAFLKNKLCLYPGNSLVNNIGTDGSGTHSGSTTIYETKPIDHPLTLQNIAIDVNNQALSKISSYFTALDLIEKEPPLFKTLIKKIIPSFFLTFYRKFFKSS